MSGAIPDGEKLSQPPRAPATISSTMAQSSVLDAPYDAGKGRRPSARHRAATVAAGAVAALGVCAGVIVVMQLRAGGAAGARTSAFAFRRQPQLALDPELHLAAQQPPAAAAAAAAAAPHPPALGGVAFTVVVPPVVAPYGEREKAVELLWSSEAGASGSNPFYHHGPNDPLVEAGSAARARTRACLASRAAAHVVHTHACARLPGRLRSRSPRDAVALAPAGANGGACDAYRHTGTRGRHPPPCRRWSSCCRPATLNRSRPR